MSSIHFINSLLTACQKCQQKVFNPVFTSLIIIRVFIPVILFITITIIIISFYLGFTLRTYRETSTPIMQASDSDISLLMTSARNTYFAQKVSDSN